MRQKIKLFLIVVSLGVLTLSIISAYSIYQIDQDIQQRLAEKRFVEPVEFYSAPLSLEVGKFLSDHNFKTLAEKFDYRRRDYGQVLRKGDYAFWNLEQCSRFLQIEPEWHKCYALRNKWSNQSFVITVEETDQINGIYEAKNLQPTSQAYLEPEIFAQFYGNKPILRKVAELGDIPRYCLDSIIAIEDPDFFKHQGISFKALFRATFANLRKFKFAQGGSTITQQLIKNYFLTPEKTLKRKIKEIVMSLLIEVRATKDDILETYLNLIYMGQNGIFEVRGFGAAANQYLRKDLDELNLAECALLSAIVNSPGRFSPFNHPQRALKRRTRVLEKMLDTRMITPEELEIAAMEPLPKKGSFSKIDPAPYFVDAVKKQIASIDIEIESGLKIYTTMDTRYQKAARQAVQKGLKRLTERFKKEPKDKEKPFQGFLISSNPKTGEVKALIGGRSFASSPYNRAIEAKRQIGSVMKPFVYLTAFSHELEDGTKLTPLSKLSNHPFTHTYQNQSWSPKNYSGTFIPPEPPLFYSLKQSMNVPTAKLALDIGINKVQALASAAGLKSPMQSFPSLSLGAFEMKGTEVLEAYNTLNQFGIYRPLQFIYFIKNYKGDVLFVSETHEKRVAKAVPTAQVVSILKEVMRTGTARFSRKLGFDYESAGKTGTTNDTKDSWFAGFTPYHSAVAWVGHDDGSSSGLTGASGALMLWTDYMRTMSRYYANDDFNWPENTELRKHEASELIKLGIPAEKAINTQLLWPTEDGLFN